MTVGCMVGGENDYPLSNVGPIHHIQDMNPNPGYGGPSSYYSPGSSYHGGGPGTPGSTAGPGGPHASYPGGPMSPYTPGGGPMSPYSQGQGQSPTPATDGGGSSGSLYSNQSSPYNNSGGYPQPPFHQPIPGGGYHYGNHSPTYGQYVAARLPLSHPTPPVMGPGGGGMLPSPVRIPHPMNSPNQNLSSMGGNQIKTEPMDLKGGGGASNGPFSQAYQGSSVGGGLTSGFSGFNSNYPARPSTSSPMSPAPGGDGGTPTHDSPHHHPQDGGSVAPSSSNMSPGQGHLGGGGGMSSNVYSTQLQQQQNSPSNSNMGGGGGGATTQASNFTSHTPQPQYSSSGETGAGGNPLGGPGYDYFGNKAPPPTSQPSPSQSSSYGGVKDPSIKTENTADNGDDNQLHGGTGGMDDVKVKEEYDGGGGGGEAGERSVRSTDSLNSPVKSEKLEGFNYDDRLKSEAGANLTSLPDNMSDFRQHCIKPSLSPGPGGEDAAGLHHPHMGEFNMGDEHKEEGGVGYGGGPEMGSWQMPGMEGYPPPHLQYPNQQQMWANFYNSGGGGGGGPEDHLNGGGRYHGAMSPHMLGAGNPMEAWWQAGGTGPHPGDHNAYRLPGPLPGMHPGAAPGPWAMRGSRTRNERRGPGRPRLTKAMASGNRAPSPPPFYPGPDGLNPDMMGSIGSPGEMKRGPGRPKAMMDASVPKMPDTTKNGNKKRYTCEVCQKRFSTAWYVRVHRRSHNGERPYVCNNCGKGFMLPNVLQVHLRKCEKNNPPGTGSSSTAGVPQGAPGMAGEGGLPPDQSPIHPGSAAPLGISSGGGVGPPPTSYGFAEATGGGGGHLPPHSQPHQGIQGMQSAFNQRYLGDMTPPHMSSHQPPYPPPPGMDMGQQYGATLQGVPDRYPHHPGMDAHSPNQFSPLYSPNSGGSGGGVMPAMSSAPNSESNSEHHFLANAKPLDKGGGDSLMALSPASSSGGSGDYPHPPGAGYHQLHHPQPPPQAPPQHLTTTQVNSNNQNGTNYCSACDVRFEDKAAMEEHMKTHRPFPCEICERRFSQKCNLVTHLRLHTGEKPYVCDFCEKKFTQKGNLDAHIKTHTKEKPYHCNLCSKKFSFKTSLQTHLKNHEAGTLALDVDEDDIETLKQCARMQQQQIQQGMETADTPPADHSSGEDCGTGGISSLPSSPGPGHHSLQQYGATVQLQNQLYPMAAAVGAGSGSTTTADADISKLTAADSRQTVAML